MSPIRVLTTAEADEIVGASRIIRECRAESVSVSRIDCHNDVLGFFVVLRVSADAAILIRREPTDAEQRAAAQAEAAERSRQVILARLREEEIEASRERMATTHYVARSAA